MSLVHLLCVGQIVYLHALGVLQVYDDGTYNNYFQIDVLANICCGCIGTTNNLLTGEMLDVDSPNDATVLCTFLCEFNSSAHCRVQYGTDPTYMNLPYSAVSTGTGRVGNSIRVVLREQLNSSTVYYYSVSSIIGGISVTVRGTFTTPQYSKCVHV